VLSGDGDKCCWWWWPCKEMGQKKNDGQLYTDEKNLEFSSVAQELQKKKRIQNSKFKI
jgi:hypothetical protein